VALTSMAISMRRGGGGKQRTITRLYKWDAARRDSGWS
jgi:hypothetical protein